jgi:hypothetical protein
MIVLRTKFARARFSNQITAQRASTHALPRDLNFFRPFVNADKIVSSSPVRLDETLPKLVELAHHVDQCSFARRLARTIDAMSCN